MGTRNGHIGIQQFSEPLDKRWVVPQDQAADIERTTADGLVDVMAVIRIVLIDRRDSLRALINATDADTSPETPAPRYQLRDICSEISGPGMTKSTYCPARSPVTQRCVPLATDQGLRHARTQPRTVVAIRHRVGGYW